MNLQEIRSIRVNEKEEGDRKGKEEWAQMMGRASHCSNMRSHEGQKKKAVASTVVVESREGFSIWPLQLFSPK